MNTIATAPALTRKLVKRAPFIRRELSRASKAEESGTAGAKREREKLTADFARDLHEVERAIADAHKTATDLQFAHLVLKTGSDLGSDAGPLTRLAAVAVRLGATPSTLTELTATAATRATQAAEQAEDRLDSAEPELRSVALSAQLLALLPGVKFNTSHPSVRRIKNMMFDASEIAAKQRKSKA